MVLPEDVIEFSSKMAVSCGNGIEAPLAPPLDVLQDDVALYEPPDVATQYLVTPAGNVIPELPRPFPKFEPETGAQAPAIVISLKFTFEKLADDAVSVLAVPIVFVSIRPICVALVDVHVSKVLIV